MTLKIDPEISSVLSPHIKSVNRTFNFEGTEIITQFMRCSAECDTLIVRFHGAIQRENRQLPAFQANLKQMEGYAHQLSICDPTMMTREGFSLGWFAGHEALDVQSILRRFFKQVREVLSIRRMIYLGSSGGGFAALYYSYFDPDSSAVVMGPQTTMKAHIPAALNAYISNCWPDRKFDEVARTIETDMCSLYEKGHENSVIFVQSSGDLLHNHRHMAPFVNAVHGNGTRENKKFILVSDFWGSHGHAGAIPHEGYISWLISAISARSLAGGDILDAYAATASKSYAAPTTQANRKLIDSRPDADAQNGLSTRMADLLRDYHLRQPLES